MSKSASRQLSTASKVEAHASPSRIDLLPQPLSPSLGPFFLLENISQFLPISLMKQFLDVPQVSHSIASHFQKVGLPVNFFEL